MKPKFSMDIVNDNVDNAKSCRWKRLILQFAAKTNFPREYFLAADRGNHIIKGHKLSSVCFSFKSSAFRRSFFWRRFVWQSVFQVKFQVHGKVESASAESRISEQILLQVTKGFRFQKNKNVHFISGNYSCERFSWKVKTIRCGLYVLISKHVQYRCLEFTILNARDQYLLKP